MGPRKSRAMKVEISERDVLLIESALTMRARALDNIATENSKRAPDCPELASDARRHADELRRIADEVGSQLSKRHTIPAASDEEFYNLISTNGAES